MSRGRTAAAVLMALRYLAGRRFATLVSIGAIALSLLLVIGVGLVNFAIKKTAVEGAIRYPLIIGPEGVSAVQLIFSTVFHVDKPSGTIPFGRASEESVNTHTVHQNNRTGKTRELGGGLPGVAFQGQRGIKSSHATKADALL